SLRRQVSVVFEESFLFSTTIAENIAFGRPDATRDEIVAAAKVACAHEFISSLPDGYDTAVGERGFTLSGGQRQRIALARAALLDPAVLILDDATSAIDAQTEEAIFAALAHRLGARTTVLIAHRSSTLRLADRVLVVDDGRIVADGTDAELWHTSRLYRELLTGPDLGEEPADTSAVTAPTTAAWPYPDGDGPGHGGTHEIQMALLLGDQTVGGGVAVGGGV
ncbi:MAG TPA: ATP-binding cassette domain-containing protein, partial [Ilumatobacteraceae bacterium]|nr:ATP-binding cassette domain-containing protein [Ilumatobacteraceae bacterium]